MTTPQCCNFCAKKIGPDNKGAANDIGYVICQSCIKVALQAINDPKMMTSKVIYLDSYKKFLALNPDA